MNEITYGQCCKFVSETFHKFNGIVNPTFPADAITFMNNPCKDILGDSIGNIITIGVANILEVSNISNLSKAQIFGMLFHVVIHELLHLEQNMIFYDEMLGKEDKYYADNAKEASCHARTIKTIRVIKKDLFDNIGFDIDFVASSKWHPLLQTEESIESWDKMYVATFSALSKTIFFLDRFTFNFNLDNPELRINNLASKCDYLDLIVDRNILGLPNLHTYITYNQTFVHWRYIMNVINQIIFLGYYNNYDSGIYATLEETNNCKTIKISFNNPIKMDIVEKH